MSYTYRKDPLTFFGETKPESEYSVLTVANYDKYQYINPILNFNHKVPFWQPNYTIGLTKPFFSTMYLEQNIDYPKLSLSVKSYNDFALPKKFILSANYNFSTNSRDMLIDNGHYQNLDLGIRKLLLDNIIKLNFEIRDIFNWMKEKYSMKTNNVNFDQNKKRESRFVFLTVSYQLNNYKKSI